MPFPTVKPNIKKAVLFNLIKIGGMTAIAALLVLIFIKILGADFFQDVLGGLGIEGYDFGNILLWFAMAVVIILFILVLNYISLAGARYEFQQYKIVYYFSSLFFLIKSKDIHYENIANVNFDYNGFLNSLFKTGTITIELASIRENEFKMKFMDNAEQVARYIQRMVQEYKAKYYVESPEKNEFDKIAEKEKLYREEINL